MELFSRVYDLVIWPATMLVFSLGFMYFTYGLFEFMRASQQGGNTNEGKQHMLWGVAGLFVMISVTAIINIIANTIGVDPQNPVDASRANNLNVSNPAFNPFSR